jgi:hypothetical protein
MIEFLRNVQSLDNLSKIFNVEIQNANEKTSFLRYNIIWYIVNIRKDVTKWKNRQAKLF